MDSVGGWNEKVWAMNDGEPDSSGIVGNRACMWISTPRH